MKNKVQLHCGACQKKFNSSKELNEHLKICKLAKLGSLMLYRALHETEGEKKK